MNPNDLSNTSGLPVWFTIVSLVIVAMSTVGVKILGPASKKIEDYVNSHRDRVSKKIPADIADLSRQVHHLENELSEVRDEFRAYRAEQHAREARWYAEKREHDRWAYEADRRLTEHGENIGPIPEYMTPDPVYFLGGNEKETEHE